MVVQTVYTVLICTQEFVGYEVNSVKLSLSACPALNQLHLPMTSSVTSGRLPSLP